MLEGVGIGLAGTAAVGVVMYVLQQKLPYRRMLVVTGIVLVVMVGGGARTLRDVAWLPTTTLGVTFPDWWAHWFEVVPTWETLCAQAFAAALVLGPYFVAEHLKVRRPGRVAATSRCGLTRRPSSRSSHLRGGAWPCAAFRLSLINSQAVTLLRSFR